MKRSRKILRGDVERIVCSHVASGNAKLVAQLASVSIETMLLRERLAEMEDRLRSEYNHVLDGSNYKYELTTKLVSVPIETQDCESVIDQATEKFSDRVLV